MARHGLLFLLAAVSCGGGSPAPTGAVDASVVDIPDAPLEKLRPGPDATESDRRAALDAVSDAATPRADAGGAPPDAIGVAGCPGPEAYVGNPAWRATLEVPMPAPQLCARWVESSGSLDRASTANRLKESLAKMARASIAPGTYKLPDMAGKAPFALPICFWRSDRRTAATATGTIERMMHLGSPVFQVSLPVAGGTIATTLLGDGSPGAVKEVDSLQYCPGGCPGAPTTSSYLAPCEATGGTQRDTVTLEGGTVDLTVGFHALSGVSAGTESAVFTRASGSYRGVAFDQRDYFNLIYSPEHHHFARHYAVLFDAPIEGACGLELINLPGPPNAKPLRAWAVDCQLGRMAEIKVTAAGSR